MKIAFIGGGNMASALIGGLIKRGTPATDLCVVDPSADARARLVESYPGVGTTDKPEDGVIGADAVVLAVKPYQVQDVAHSIAPRLGDAMVISIAAGIRGADISRWLGGHRRIVRAMPNTPALVGMGITGAAPLDGLGEFSADDRLVASRILEAVGQVIWCDESKIDAITGISGSGPAYVFYFIEGLEAAARQFGFDPEQSRALALATVTGAAQLAAQTGEPVATLRERVTSKGGTTAAALASFEQDGLHEIIGRAALAAARRATELADEFGKD